MRKAPIAKTSNSKSMEKKPVKKDKSFSESRDIREDRGTR